MRVDPPGRRRVPVFAGLLLMLSAARAPGGEARGPVELRDAHVVAQPRLTLPAAGPRVLVPGRTRLHVGVLWGNSFAWAQDVPGERPNVRRYLIDGEAVTLDLGVARGLRDGLDVTVRVPLHWRGGGVLDGFIDAFHRVFAFAGVGDGGRPAFRRDAFRVEGRRTDGEAFTWNDARGAGLGDVELSVRQSIGSGGRAMPSRALARPAPDAPRATALVWRLSVPTGTRPFGGNGLAAGVQLVTTCSLGPRADVYFGLGATAGGSRRAHGLGYERLRGHVFATVERRLGPRVSLIAGSDAATRLVRDADGFPGLHWTAHAGAWIDTGPRTRLSVTLVENVAAQAATADLAVHLGVTLLR